MAKANPFAGMAAAKKMDAAVDAKAGKSGKAAPPAKGKGGFVPFKKGGKK